ncbi:hypothetical protein ACWEOH_17390 [Agromyces sp. NPDC004153]
MDLVSWIVVGVVIVLAAVGVALWNRFGKGRAPIGGLDRDGAREAQDAESVTKRRGGIGGHPGGL